MTRASHRALTGLIVVLLAPLAASGQEWHLELDEEETRIAFELGATLHTVHGTARLREGSVALDPVTGRATGVIVVDAGSLETGNGRRDRVMHARVLRSADFPEIRLAPRLARGELASTGESRLSVQGVLTLLGSDHDVTLEVWTRVAGETLEADLEFEVPYVAWGLVDPSRALLRVAKVVRVRVEATGRLVEAGSGSK